MTMARFARRSAFGEKGISPCSNVWPTGSMASTASSAGVRWLALAMVLVQFAIVVLRYVFGINSCR
jgi:TRAP-type mannitol/chloroaromatic compound transport system permease small subunit